MVISLLKRDDMTLAVRLKGYHAEFVTKIKRINGKRWDPQSGVWILPYTIRVIEHFLEEFKSYTITVDEVLREENDAIRQWMEVNRSAKWNASSKQPHWNAEWKQKMKD